jgi:hypothetical protein
MYDMAALCVSLKEAFDRDSVFRSEPFRDFRIKGPECIDLDESMPIG